MGSAVVGNGFARGHSALQLVVALNDDFGTGVRIAAAGSDSNPRDIVFSGDSDDFRDGLRDGWILLGSTHP